MHAARMFLPSSDGLNLRTMGELWELQSTVLLFTLTFVVRSLESPHALSRRALQLTKPQ